MRNIICIIYWMSEYTVGAQSIARAQSIAHGHIGDVVCQKTKI
jgi:hypothetical protein